MIFDKQVLFSEDQAITASAASTNVVDMGANDSYIQANPEYNNKVLVQVTADFATLTSLKIAIETDDNASFSSATELKSETVLAADLVAGKQVELMLPRNIERYVRIYYTVAGSDATAGTVMAGIVLDVQSANV